MGIITEPMRPNTRANTPSNTPEIIMVEPMKACAKCGGAGSYAYDENHSKVCEACCPCDQGWWLLERHYGERNGHYCCKRGCGSTKHPDELGVVLPKELPASTPAHPTGEVGDIVERLRAKKAVPTRPTISELEAILADPTPPTIQIMPDGSVSTRGNDLVNPDGPEAADLIQSLQSDVERLREAARQEVINAPETADFMAGVPLEAAHQRERWGADHDAGKHPLDWFWLIGYLSQKAATAHMAGDTDKALHHTISTAAALANWHLSISGTDTRMRPGIDALASLGEAG